MYTQSRTYDNAHYFFGSDLGKWDRGEKMGVNYSTFGAPMPGRTANSDSYRYGFQNQEKDPEIAEGIYAAEFWQYDSRLGRRWNIDPKPDASVSVYACLKNNPIAFTDINGDTSVVFGPDGEFVKFMDDGKVEYTGMTYQSISGAASQ